MKKEGIVSFTKQEISEVNYLIKVLGKQIEKFEAAYKKKDAFEFNRMKKEVLHLQKKIHSLVK